ncbi:MAG: glycosyltransferase family 4 protein [Pseudomonadota bacterium]
MNRNILHTEWSKGWGGQEIRIIAEASAFRKKGYNMMLACQPCSTILNKAKESGIPTILLKMRSGVDLFAAYGAWLICRKHNIHLVHTHSSVDAWCFGMAARLAGIPVVRSRHLSAPISESLFSYCLYMKLADRVITSGRAIRDVMIEQNKMQPERIVSIPAGIDEIKFSSFVDGSLAQKEFGLGAQDFVVGIVAILRSWKGHDYLIEAVERVKPDIPNIKLLIIGNGPRQRHIRSLIREKRLEDTILMTGFRDDVPSLLKTMDCFVLPSTKNEATSQVIPQAMAMKIPVISSSAGGLAEVVSDRETGLLVPPNDVNALRDAILWIYKNRKQAFDMAERAYIDCLQRFTFNKMIDDTERVYLDLLTGS